MTSRISESGTAPMRPARGPRAGRRASAPSGAGARGDAGRLGRDDWLDAAHDAVVAGGFDAVRVLSLADALGISRGSFYWHFDSHAELVAALIARWLEREAEADRALAARMSDDPVADLRRLLDAALARGGRDLKAMRFELALRELGRQDPEVAQRVLEVDARRMSVLGAHFERLTGNAREARELAALMYVAVAGAHQALAYASVAAGASGYLRDVIAKYLIGERVAAPAAGVAPVPAPDTAPSPTPARRARVGGVS